MSTLNGLRIHRAEIHVPRSGGWRAEVLLDVVPTPAPGPATLQVADLTLVGTILRGGDDAPDLPHVVVAGGAGWDVLVGDGKYSSGSAVRLSTVLRDLATLAGEPYDAPAEAMLPSAYEWTGSTPTAPRRARDVLAELVTRGAIQTWRVAPDGHTRFDAWPALPDAAGVCTVSSRDLARGLRRVALTTRAASILPGATLEGAPIDRVVFHDEAGALKADVYSESASSAPTFRRLIRALVLELFPWAERFGLTSSKDLEVKSASGKIAMAGGDLEVARRTDGCTQLAFYPGVPGVSPPILWYTNDVTEPKAWALVALAPALTPPIPGGPFTEIVITRGSSKVRSG